MPRTIPKFTLLTILTLLGVVVFALAVFMYQLSHGPVSLTFLTRPIQSAINSNLAGYQVELKEAIIEKDAQSGQPRLRLRDIALKNTNGEIIARAPKAAIGIDGLAIFAGRIVPRQLELIDAHIEIKRDVGGNFSLGFANSEVGEKESQLNPDEPVQQREESSTSGIALRDFFDRELLSGSRGETAVSTLEAVKISNASLTLFDEFNQASWNAPSANLVFKRMPYGFALFADIKIATGGEPWRSELVANYRAASRTFAVSARIYDLVPADISNKIFALHQLAQVRFPLSGQADLQLTDTGMITKATAELTAASGVIAFPDYISEPIAISEGLLRFDLEPESGAFVLHDSTLTVQGNEAAIEGRVDPVRGDGGHLSALKVNLDIRNLLMTPKNTTDEIEFDRIALKGLASVVESKFDIDDLVLQAGNAGIRVRGSFEGREQAIGVQLSGVVRDLPLAVVKKLWPPIIAPNTRKWLETNVSKGIVPDGVFRINVPGETIAGVFKGVPIPDKQLDVTFTLKDVQTGYFGSLPPISNGNGKGHIQGNRLDITLENGKITVPSGGVLTLTAGSLVTTPLTAPVVPTHIHVEGEGKATSVVELLNQDPLNYATAAGISPDSIAGNTNISLDVDLLSPRGKKPTVTIAAEAQVQDVQLKSVFQQAEITGGNMTFTYSAGRVGAKGVVKLDGVPASVTWSRAVGKDVESTAQISIEAELDDQERAKLGLYTAGFVRGPVRVKLAADVQGSKLSKATVEANLTKAELHVDPMRWWRPPGEQAAASFNLDFTDPQRKQISNLVVVGENLSIRGNLAIGPNGEVLSADFPNTVLGESNRFSIKIRRKEGVVLFVVSGKAFDARELINGTFKPSADAPSAADSVMTPVNVDAKFDTVLANRGESFSGVTAKLSVLGNFVQSAEIEGALLSGAMSTFKITPSDGGNRDMRVVSGDAGGALRAANLYSKVAGGQLELYAQLGSAPEASVQNGQLIIRNFEVRNEAALNDIDLQNQKKPAKNGPRSDALVFTKLNMPFSVDQNFVRIGDSLVKGPDMGASLQGLIRKRDGAIDIGGTIIPAYSLNAAFGEIPLFGEILTGGKGQGVFGLNFALRGSMSQPQFVVNPMSALAPGFLRRLFDIGGNYPDPSQKKRKSEPSN